MDDDLDTQSKIDALKEIALLYLNMEKGQLIDKHLERLHIFNVAGTTFAPHPHIQHSVYISRKALKHVVESRKAELLKKHSIEETCAILSGMLEEIPFVFEEFDVYRLENNTHYYKKDYPGQPSIQIGCDWSDKSLEIKTIHFVKMSKTKKPA